MIDRSFENNCTPQYFYDKLTDITADDLRKMGAKGIGLDIDNTLAYDCSYTLLPGAKEWTRKMRAEGFPLIIISNTYPLRARVMSKKFDGMPAIGNSKKPNPRNFLRGAEILGIDVSELAFIGDQLFTDIRGANDSGAISIRIRPTRTEYFLFFRYQILRKQEHDYLKLKGFGDKR
jgi:uncharacterized protein